MTRDIVVATVAMAVIAAALYGTAAWRSTAVVTSGALGGARSFVTILPLLALSFAIAGLVQAWVPRELIARIRALLRRVAPTDTEQAIEVQGLRLDPVAHRVYADGKPVEMGPTEFRLLHFLMSHPDRAYTRSQLLDNVWGANVYIDERTVDVHVRRLRKALEAERNSDPDFAQFIQTVRGTGYRFSDQTPRG